MEFKKCIKCEEVKSIDEFIKSKLSKTGFINICKECERKRTKDSYEKHKERKLEQNKRWSLENKEHHRMLQYKWREENKDKVKDSARKCSSKKNDYHKNKIKNDPLYKLRCSLRTRTYLAFKTSKWYRNSSNKELLGCDFRTAFMHLEQQFTKGMSWANHGEWHIDHIIPLSSAKTEEEINNLFHYTNLQPLWAKDNLSKNNLMPNIQIKLTI